MGQGACAWLAAPAPLWLLLLLLDSAQQHTGSRQFMSAVIEEKTTVVRLQAHCKAGFSSKFRSGIAGSETYLDGSSEDAGIILLQRLANKFLRLHLEDQNAIEVNQHEAVEERLCDVMRCDQAYASPQRRKRLIDVDPMTFMHESCQQTERRRQQNWILAQNKQLR